MDGMEEIWYRQLHRAIVRHQCQMVVIDSYNEYVDNDSHNRSLFEQGSVVIVEDQLHMNIPYDQCDDSAVFLKDIRQLMDWKMFCQTFIKDESMKQKVMDYENPVVFLGAHESDYNTSAWCLLIEKRATETVTDFNRSKKEFQVTYGRQCVLEVPEGGYIMAVEEWRDGMDEIWYRHRYEQLHRAIVRHQMPHSIIYIRPRNFRLPPQVGDWLNKIILNTSAKHPAGRQLSISIYTNEIREAYRQLYERLSTPYIIFKDHVIRPKEFNFRQFVGQHVDRQLADSYCKSVSPAYPPVKVTDPDGSHRLFYLPQKLLFDAQLDSGVEQIKCNLLTVFKKYDFDKQTYCTVGGKTHINTNNPKVILKLIKTKAEFNEYQWKWLDNPFVDKHQLLNREEYRLGVDGHYYHKWSPANNTQHIGKVLSVYYEFTEFGTDRPIQVNIQSKSGNFLPQTNPFRWRKDYELDQLFQKRPFLFN
ncbi:uncharacterized protein LOC128953573 [Oppia nitens]|uniref:uncharacterized protein LOC128953573 n=1 Tax=Oppia nitens TaxID=1686743 RepID=UPI0023DC29A1|nr:uncharacterized protein LOC128953573 [Oppia nitens]